MKILTLNTWQERGPWKERWEVILQGIKEFKPDVVGFQELFNREWAQEIQKRTGYSTLLFQEASGGLVLYSVYSVVRSGWVMLSPSPLEEYSRHALWAELKIHDKPLFIFNTHFSWMLEDGETRKKQVKEVLQLIAEKAGTGELILMGDLNATRSSPEIRHLVEKGDFQDLLFEKHPSDSNFTWDNRNPYVAEAQHKLPDRRIDFILSRGSGPLLKTLVSCERVFIHPNARGIWASDHFGVLTEFK